MTIHILTSYPNEKQIEEMLQAIKDYIKIRPRQNNRGMIIQDPLLREKVSGIVLRIFKGEQ